MLEKIANKLTRKPKLVILIATLLLIPSILGAALTRINYDILSYLPQDLDSAKGEALLEEPFHMAAREVSFTMAISELDRGGKAVRMAWGRTIRPMICR